MDDTLPCYGGPLDGEARDACPPLYQECNVTIADGSSEHVWLFWPYRCECGRAIAKWMTQCGPCSGASDD